MPCIKQTEHLYLTFCGKSILLLLAEQQEFYLVAMVVLPMFPAKVQLPMWYNGYVYFDTYMG